MIILSEIIEEDLDLDVIKIANEKCIIGVRV